MISTTELVYALQGWAAEGGIPERDAPVIRAFLTGLLGTEKGREHVYAALEAAQEWSWADADAATCDVDEARAFRRAEKSAAARLATLQRDGMTPSISSAEDGASQKHASASNRVSRSMLHVRANVSYAKGLV